MTENLKIIAWCASIWIFAWLAGSFASANFNIIEWHDFNRYMTSMFACFACLAVIIVHKVK